MSAARNGPVIIKRKKVVAGDGHHGGAWKVAYADFVTAMMAFFLLMWLLNATTEKQRKGIADYFNPTVPVNRISGGGDGAFGGESIFSEEVLTQTGTGASARTPTEERQARGREGDGQGQDSDQAALEKIEKLLSARSGESMSSELALRHVTTKLTDEGLIVELFDLPGAPLFEPLTARPYPVTVDLIEMITDLFDLAANDVAIGAFTRAHPLVMLHDPAWDLSTGRAQAVRAAVEATGFDATRIKRVTGHGDRSPAVPEPMSSRNNRVELILLRNAR